MDRIKNMTQKGNQKSKRSKSTLTKISEVLPLVREELGIEKQLKINALKDIWPLVTSFEIAKFSQPVYFDKENNLVISVQSPTLATELSMQKMGICSRLKEATKNTDITFKDIRFTTRS